MEGYCYKILFADGSWYWGTSQYKGVPPEMDGYYGSPIAHRSKWKEPHSKIVLKTFYEEQERLDYEDLCIKLDLDNPKCLNEHGSKGFSKEACRKGAKASAEKSRGVPRTAKVKEKIAIKHRGKKLTPEHIQKLRDAERPPRTLEAISKQVESRKGYRHSQETIEKISEAHKGKEVPLEVRSKISKSVKGFKWYNNGEKSIQSRTHPGVGWVEGRITGWETPRNSGMKWYHRNGEKKMFREHPGGDWEEGNPTPKGKKYYNNGTDHVLAYESPGEGWVPGRLRKS